MKKIRSYGFDLEPTGSESIDGILQAVADAGRRFHNTCDWNDADYGETCAASIQNAANKASAALKVAEEALKETEYWRDRHCKDAEGYGKQSVQHWEYWKKAEADCAAMRQYARHKRGCKVNPGGEIMKALLGSDVSHACTCGFDAALSSTSGQALLSRLAQLEAVERAANELRKLRQYSSIRANRTNKEWDAEADLFEALDALNPAQKEGK